MTRVRTLKDVSAARRFFRAGTVLRVPEDLDEATARSWVKAGLVEEDKMVDRAPETKDSRPELVVVEEKLTKKPNRGRRIKCRIL